MNRVFLDQALSLSKEGSKMVVGSMTGIAFSFSWSLIKELYLHHHHVRLHVVIINHLTND